MQAQQVQSDRVGATKEEILEAICNLTVSELCDLMVALDKQLPLHKRNPLYPIEPVGMVE